MVVLKKVVKGDETSSILADLPRIEWLPHLPLFQYKGFWSLPETIESLPHIETKYKSLPTDVLIASFPKSGTTWLKAIIFAILHNSTPNDLLQTHNPHQLVPFLEREVFGENPTWKIDEITSPRIFGTHLPYSFLPKMVKEGSFGSKIIYISRNPADIIVSAWHFSINASGSRKTIQEFFDEFIDGTIHVGPLFDHVLEYWEERERENMLFITYEELKEYPNENVKRIAEFLECSLSDDEIEQVVRKTSFEHLSKLDINNTDKNELTIAEKQTPPYSSYFRSGSVGDGKKCLTPEMLKRLNDIAYQKWGGTSLESKLLNVEP